MIQKGDIKLDEQKLKEEDRRFLISDVTQRYITNEQMRLNNRSLLISMVALSISISILILSLDFISIDYRVLSVFMLFLLVLVLIYNFKKDNQKIDKQNKGLNSNYSNLFLHHFKYALRKK